MVYFNYEALSKLLNKLSVLVGAKISIWNDKFEPTEATGFTDNKICSFIKEKDKNLCEITDNDALAKANHVEGAINYHCHFGFVEIMIKEYVDNVPFYFCVGPFVEPSNRKKDVSRIKEYCKLRHADYKPYLDEYNKMPLFSIEKYNAIVTAVNTLIDYCKETRIIANKEDVFESKIAPFLKANIAKNFTIEELCDIFAMPSKKFHLIVKKATGFSPKQYITRLKIEKAYQDIILTNKELQEIASSVGIDDYNYFIKLFKAIKGHTPKYFRKEAEKNK